MTQLRQSHVNLAIFHHILAPRMTELEWIEGLVCFADRAQLDSNLITGVEQTWETLRAGRIFPTRGDIDPIAFRRWLPYLSIMELHDKPFRVRYRLVGTEVTRFSGEDFTGSWLHETAWEKNIQTINLTLYRRVFDLKAPVFGLSKVEWQGSTDHTFQWGLFPLGDADGTITHCLSADDFTPIAEPSGLLRENFDDAPLPTSQTNSDKSKA